jgi:mannosyl-3-phosphoglycerate phosphatase
VSRARTIVVSDLDGTLLRHEDYAPGEALPAIALLRERGIPLILASSKTRAEMEAIRAALDVFDPFIVENGGALLWPVGCEPTPPPEAEVAGPYARIVYGTPYAVLREALRRVEEAVGVPLRGFGDVSAERIGAWTGLRDGALERASRREYDEPFRPDRELTSDEEAALGAAAASLGLRVTRGGRFHHLIGPSSKARAMRDLRRAYDAAGDAVTVIAVGDGPNDLEMLAESDRAIVVARPDGTPDPVLVAGCPSATVTRGIGPAGFAEGIASLDLAAASGRSARS